MTATETRCEERHFVGKLQSSLFLTLKPKGKRSIEQMIEAKFSTKHFMRFCKKCDKEVKCTYKTDLEAVPRALMIAVDQFDE